MKHLRHFFLPFLTLLPFFTVTILGILYYQQIQFKNTSSPVVDPLVSELDKIMLLPEGTPKISTIDNVSQALQQDEIFYKNAKVGDKLLAYPYLIILYDSIIKKIVNVKTFNPPAPLPLQTLRISFRYNGKDDSRAMSLKKSLESVSPLYHITEVIPSKAVYKEDVIYQIRTERSQDIKNFAKAIGDSPILDTLEPNETTADADLIVAFADKAQ